MLIVNVYDSTIRKRPNGCGLFGKVARREALLSKKKMTAWLRLPKPCLAKTTHKTSAQTAPTVKHGSIGAMIWACFAATRPGPLTVPELTRNCSPESVKANE